MSYVLIIGSESEVSMAVAEKYARYGYNIYFTCKKPEQFQAEINKIEFMYGVKSKAVRFDPLEFYSHKLFYENLNPKPVGVICLIDYHGDQYEAENDFLEAKKIIDINLIGSMSILNIVANDFEQKREGFIVGVSSVMGERGRRSNYLYGSAKAGFIAYLSGLRSRLIESDVQVTTIKSGITINRTIKNIEYPLFLSAKPEEVAYDIFKAQQKNRDIAYSKWQWKFASMLIKHMPETIFKRIHT